MEVLAEMLAIFAEVSGMAKVKSSILGFSELTKKVCVLAISKKEY
jgi:hypothetical protein